MIMRLPRPPLPLFVLVASACVAELGPPADLAADATTSGAASATSIGDGEVGGVVPGVADLGGDTGEFVTTGAADPTDGGPQPPRNTADCCMIGAGIGCEDRVVAACVCAVDDYCCTKGWDQLCVEQVDQLGCGACKLDPNSDVVPACCNAHDGPSCLDIDVAQCVCAQDPYCCEVAWDQNCADAVIGDGCGVCPESIGPTSLGSCCEAATTPGCDDPIVEACVCGQDGYCCANAWDDICVGEVASYGCGMCPVDAGTGGDTGAGSEAGAEGGSTGAGSSTTGEIDPGYGTSSTGG